MTKQEELKLVERISKVIANEWPNFSEKWERQKMGYKYIGSEQYTKEQIEYYEFQQRPTHVFNAVFEKFNHVLGEHFLTDQKQRVVRKAGGDPQTAHILEDILDHYHTLNNYRMELGKTVLAGWIDTGFIYPRFSNEIQIDGSPVYKNEDEFLILYDSRSRDYFLDDAKYIIRFRYMTTDDIIELWPDKKSKLKEVLRDVEESSFTWTTDWMGENHTNPYFHNILNGKYLVAEFHEMPFEVAEVVLDPVTQEAHVLDVKDPKRRDLIIRGARISGKKIIERREKIKKITTIIPGLNFFLDQKEADVQDGTYDIIPYSPYPFASRTIDNFGMMKIIAHPQDFLNDMSNRFLEMMNKSANVGVEYVPAAYENSDDIESAGNRPGLIWKKKEQYVGQKTRENIDPPRIPAEPLQMIQEAKYFVQLVSTTDELVGRQKEAGAPASLYAQKVAQGNIRFAVPSHFLNMVKTRLNNKLIRICQSQLNSERLFLIQDKSGNERQIMINIQMGNEILNNIQVGEYEVIIDNTAMNPLARSIRHQEKMLFLQNVLMPLLGPQAAFAVDWEDLLMNSDLGDMKTWAEKINMVLQQMGAQGEQQQALDTINQITDAASGLMDGRMPHNPQKAPGA